MRNTILEVNTRKMMLINPMMKVVVERSLIMTLMVMMKAMRVLHSMSFTLLVMQVAMKLMSLSVEVAKHLVLMIDKKHKVIKSSISRHFNSYK